MKLAYLALAFCLLVTSRVFAAPTPPAPEPGAPAAPNVQPGSPPGAPLDRGPAAHGLRRPPHAFPGVQRPQPEMTAGGPVAATSLPAKEEAEEHGPKEINWVDFDNKEQPPTSLRSSTSPS